jgi:hypothetical protein
MILGVKGEYTLGFKYDRVPYGEFHVVGDFSGAHASHSMTVGTSFFVNAGETAEIQSKIITLTASSEVPEITEDDAAAQNAAAASAYASAYAGLVSLQGVAAAGPPPPPIVAVEATTNESILTLTDVEARLTGGQNTTTNTTPASLSLTPAGATLTGITAENLVSILAAALLINHTTSASLGVSSGNSITANPAGVTIIGAPAVVVTGEKFQVNAPQTYLGTPAVTAATYADLLTAATGAADAAVKVAAAAAAEADAAAAAAAGTAAATGH